MAYHCPVCCRRSIWCRCCQKRHCQCEGKRHVSPKPDHKGKNVLVKQQGSNSPVLMSSREYAQQVGRSKGGKTTAARYGGPTNRFTSETGRKAIKKAWATRWKMLGWSKTRVTRRQHLKPKKLDRAALRAYYAEHPTNGIVCRHVMGKGYVWSDYRECDCPIPHWCADCWGSGIVPLNRVISEATALRRLGHLTPDRKGVVPVGIITTIQRRGGKLIATPTHQKETE